MNLTAKTFQGLEDVLAKELENIGAWNIKPIRRAVTFDANKEVLYKSNLHARTALRVLQPIFSFKARNENELYKNIFEYKWESLLTTRQTFAIDTVVFSPVFNHSKFVALKVKDAIADSFRKKQGVRPDVNLENPDLLINVHIAGDKVIVSLDSSGDSLHKRGYRQGNHRAPLNEVLAAGMILLSGWDKEQPLIDLMCGSGTIVMEAAMIATNTAPGLNRRQFGFERWNNFDVALWEKIKNDAKAVITQPRTRILGSDIDSRSIDMARVSALEYKLKQYINFEIADFNKLQTTWKNGVIITNPPYDERLKSSDIVGMYRSLGNVFKRNFAGYKAWVISSNNEALKQVGLKPSKKITLFNGSLECKFECFDLFEGSIKRPVIQ